MIRRAAIALVACAALLVAGCGGGGGGASDDLASLAPADASVYLESVIRPEGGQKDAIESLASRVGGIQDPGGAILSRLNGKTKRAQAAIDALAQRLVALREQHADIAGRLALEVDI